MLSELASTGWAAGELLAAEESPKGPEFGKSSPLALVVILVLLVGTFALIYSMNKHVRNLPETFERSHPAADQARDEGTDLSIAELSDTEDVSPATGFSADSGTSSSSE